MDVCWMRTMSLYSSFLLFLNMFCDMDSDVCLLVYFCIKIEINVFTKEEVFWPECFQWHLIVWWLRKVVTDKSSEFVFVSMLIIYMNQDQDVSRSAWMWNFKFLAPFHLNMNYMYDKCFSHSYKSNTYRNCNFLMAFLSLPTCICCIYMICIKWSVFEILQQRKAYWGTGETFGVF